MLRFSVSDVTSKSKKIGLSSSAAFHCNCIVTFIVTHLESHVTYDLCWDSIFVINQAKSSLRLWILQSLTNCIWPSIVTSMLLHKKKIGIKCAIFQSCLPHHYIPQLHPQLVLWLKNSSPKKSRKKVRFFGVEIQSFNDLGNWISYCILARKFKLFVIFWNKSLAWKFNLIFFTNFDNFETFAP